jgi:hypothetical protein
MGDEFINLILSAAVFAVFFEAMISESQGIVHQKFVKNNEMHAVSIT